jgi:hypothetical protein
MPREVAAKYSDDFCDDPDAPERAAALQRLKKRILDDVDLSCRVRGYSARWDRVRNSVSDLEAWGNEAFDDLWHELEPATRDWLEPEADENCEQTLALVQFIGRHGPVFAGRKARKQGLLNIARSREPAESVGWQLPVGGGLANLIANGLMDARSQHKTGLRIKHVTRFTA